MSVTEIAMQADPKTAPPPPLGEELERQFHECGLIRPFRRARYEPGQRLEYRVTGVMPAHAARIVAEVEGFVGGGFAGQVYRVKLLEVDADDDTIEGLVEGKSYAIKILKPPSGFACAFRDFLYFLGYQAPFGAQAHPAAVRVGVLWQKLIRRAVAVTFGEQDSVCDTYATFYDGQLQSFGEINEWVDGRIWKFEVDDQLFERWQFDGEPPPEHHCPEYVHKRLFMRRLVRLLHEMGAPELARQYEWWTCKSQPNALKRISAEHSPKDGITAIDFRAGLTLLPVLPMSPADFGLILRGLVRGRLVQFDRSDPKRFRQFMEAHRAEFADLEPAVEELQEQETIYRSSLPDVTHHHVRLLASAKLRRSVKEGVVTAWRNLGRLDDEHAARLKSSRWLFPLMFLIAAVPLLGRRVLKLWGDARTRRHVGRMFSSPSYLQRAMRGSRIERLIKWHRRGRASEKRVRKLVDRPVRYGVQLVLCGWMPAKLHRFLAEPGYAWEKVREKVRFTFSFLTAPSFREAWLLEQVRLGREEGMLTEAEAEKISHQIKDPFMQRYLRCFAVHLCTVPVTQVCMLIVFVAVAGYLLSVRGTSWVEATAAGFFAAGLLQVLPISPGSIARGTFVVFMMIRDRDVRNYCIAAPASFLHVVGYLAFPMQMVAHNPALAQFMAGRFAKNLVHYVPVFGERGALLEHAVFDAFFNFPLSARRGFKTKPIRWTIGTTIVTLVLGTAIGWAGLHAWRWVDAKSHGAPPAAPAAVSTGTDSDDGAAGEAARP